MLDKVESPPHGGVTKAEAVIALCGVLLQWKDKIEEALHRVDDPFDFDQIVEMVVVGKVHAFPYEDCLLLMEVLQFGKFKSYHCFIAVGDMEAITKAEPDLIRVGQQLGCKEMTINGRIGWPKIAKKFGWKHKSSLLMKEI